MKDRLYNLMCEADLESGCVYGDCDLKFIANHLIDSGLVIVLPCKVGDTVYAIEGNDICENKTTEIFFNTDGKYIFDKDVVGKSVFLTKEEAEAKLKELQGE